MEKNVQNEKTTKAYPRSQQNFDTFLDRLTLYCGGTSLLDGYILTVIGPALMHLRPLMGIDVFWTGAIGSAALMGVLFGGPIFGYLSDKIGRKAPFVAIPFAMAVLSIASIFVTGPTGLFIIRFLAGVVVGSDYPSATAYLAEYSPPRRRGIMIGVLILMLSGGMTLGEIVGYLTYDSDYAWQILLGAPAVVAIPLALARRRYPESPRWLINKGRAVEARVIMKAVYGFSADTDDVEETTVKTSYRELLQPLYLKRIFFASVFWATSVLPMFVMYIFGAVLLQDIQLGEGRGALLGNSIIGLIFIVGVVAGIAIIERFGRRPLLIWSFVGMALGLLLLAIVEEPPFWLVVLGFTIYALASGPPNVLDWLYPNELFPTEVRAAGVGTVTAISRFGPILGTFGLPYFLENFGIQATMLTIVGILGFGLVVTVLLAPETRGLDLAESSGSIHDK